MKIKILSLFIVAVATGCCHAPYRPTEPCATMRSTGYMVVNNTKALLNIVQDGQTIATGLEPGQVMPIRPVWARTTIVVAVGYTPDGTYLGSDSYTFASNVRESWTVTRLIRPNDTPPWH
jgi:hypothetical protein